MNPLALENYKKNDRIFTEQNLLVAVQQDGLSANEQHGEGHVEQTSSLPNFLHLTKTHNSEWGEGLWLKNKNKTCTYQTSSCHTAVEEAEALGRGIAF